MGLTFGVHPGANKRKRVPEGLVKECAYQKAAFVSE